MDEGTWFFDKNKAALGALSDMGLSLIHILFESVCGKFDPDCYVAYLEKKFTEVYGLS